MHTLRTNWTWLAAVSIVFSGMAIAHSETVAPVDEGPESSSGSSLSRVSAGVFVGGGLLGRGVELGNSFFSDQVPRSGLLFGARGAFALVPSMAAGTSIDPRLSAEVELRLLLSSTGSSEERNSSFAPVLGWRGHVVLDLWPDKRAFPFVLAGIGAETVFGSNRFMETPDTDMAAHVGGGVKYSLRENLGLRADARLAVTSGRTKAVAPIYEIHLGGYYRFGGAEVSRSAEPVVATARRPDMDGDGVSDEIDQCPQEPEIVNEIDDEDGCPEVDSDGDGLLGTRDRCPDAKEDADGFEDEDGCPDLDNDGDGIPDASDKCVAEAESPNGFQDEDGCPDEVPDRVAEFTGAIEGIRFALGSASIVPSSRKTLDAAVRVLAEYPQIRIEVGGHTDATGSRDSNMELSGKRADYVKWYLVDKGIAAERIETVGYGPDRPKADNAFAAGRAQNRRIEFKLLGQSGASSPPGSGGKQEPPK